MDYRTVDGRLVADAEVKTNKAGRKYLSFRLANNGFKRGEQTTTFFNVASYNEYAIQKHEQENFYSRGKLVVVIGESDESMSEYNGKMYLNRSILAYNIQLGQFDSRKDDEKQPKKVYRDVAPAISAPTCEVPAVAQPQVEIPAVAVSPAVEVPMPAPAPAPMPVTPQAATAAPQIEDDLPF